MATCPAGHKLPRRVGGLRCSPLDCVGEGESSTLAKPVQTPAEVKREVEDEFAQELAAAQARRAQLNAVHPVPAPVPPPTDARTPAEYLRRRLEQVMPTALEHTVQTLMTSTGARADRAASELMDRGGLSRNPEGNMEFNGPVLIVGSPVGLRLPWNQQQTVLESGEAITVQEVMERSEQAKVVQPAVPNEEVHDHHEDA